MPSLNFLLIHVIFVSFAKGNLPSFLYSTNVSDATIPNNNCPSLKPVLNGYIEIKSLNMGPIAAIITCYENYSLIGKSIVYCDDGVWSFGFNETPPKCVKRCPPPPYLEHGKLKLEKIFEDVYSPTGSYLKGTVAKYTCIEGYILEPPSSLARVCENGYWTGSDAFCKPNMEITCASPPIIEDGYMQPSFPIDYSLIAVGQEVVYQCALGYKLVGSDRIKCTDHGVWVPKAPSCHKETGNPFADFSAPAPVSAPVPNGVPDFFSAQPTANQVVNNQNMWGNNVASANTFQAPTQPASQQPFNDLTGFFNTNEPSVFDPLAPTDQKHPPAVPSQPSMPPQRPPQPSKIFTGDLETSLNSLVENLTMESGGGKWNSPKNQPKTSGSGGWQPQPMAATTAASYRPMMGAQQSQMMGQQPIMQPMMGAPMQYSMGAVQQPQMMGSPKIGAPGTQPQQQAAFDPFGAL